MSLSSDYRRQNGWRAWPSIFDALPPLRGQTVLDLGCGVGDQAAELAARGARVIGVDMNEELLREAESRCFPNTELQRCDLRSSTDLDLSGRPLVQLHGRVLPGSSGRPHIVGRVLVRLGLVREERSYSKTYAASRQAAKALPAKPSVLQEAHLLLQQHGQTLCKRNAPRCEGCPLAHGCAYAQRERGRAQGAAS